MNIFIPCQSEFFCHLRSFTLYTMKDIFGIAPIIFRQILSSLPHCAVQLRNSISFEAQALDRPSEKAQSKGVSANRVVV